MPVSWRWGRGSCPDAQSRAMSGESGQHSISWTLSLDFPHVFSLSRLGTGQLPVLEGLSLAFRRFPASGSRGLMAVRSQ